MPLDLLQGQEYSLSKAGAKKFASNVGGIVGLGVTIVTGLTVLKVFVLPLIAKVPWVGPTMQRGTPASLRLDENGTVVA